MKDDIHFLEDECDFLHYEVYIRNHLQKLINEAHNMSWIKHVVNLKKKIKGWKRNTTMNCEKKWEEILGETKKSSIELFSKNDEFHLENAQVVKVDDIALQTKHVEGKNTEI